MPAVMEVPPETALLPSANPLPFRPLATEENGRFAVGNRGGPGRPKGMKNAEKAYLKAAPELAKAYIKTALKGNPTLLVDSRKWIMPLEADGDGHNPTTVNILIASPTPSLPASVTPALNPPSVAPSLPAAPLDVPASSI